MAEIFDAMALQAAAGADMIAASLLVIALVAVRRAVSRTMPRTLG